MTGRIFRSICSAAVGVFIVSLALVMGLMYGYYSRAQAQELRAQTALVARGASLGGEEYFSSLGELPFRVTWIDAGGGVIYDSSADPEQMENHLQREEVVQALESGFGESSRYSSTLTERLFYCAQRLPDGTVIRLASTQYTVLTLLLGMLQPLILIVLAAIAASFALAYRLSRAIVSPLNEIDLDEPRRSRVYPELAPLVERITGQQYMLRAQNEALARRRAELEAASAGMSEGLILVGENGDILSINPAAERILSAPRGAVGADISSLDHGGEIRALLEKARSGAENEAQLSSGGRDWRVCVSPVTADGKYSGAALLLFDVTEKEKAARSRREFTANVSHELKTPLHTISGCAELLRGGMVKQEDLPAFYDKIYAESRRMTTLVEDIIRLSRLDEGALDAQSERLDIGEISRQTLESLEPAAHDAGVALALHGEGGAVTGVRQLVSGIVYNLCENAVKYNRPGGRVDVTVESRPGGVMLTVADTGVGIPEDEHERVFERFYRVDKSRSKAVGGTGLGLSIVKHSAELLGAEISLSSTPGSGTKISVFFPEDAKPR